ncbi:MAG: OmpA family protein [Alphaproteobacteria bacterium]|nr:OmpA family protein [Alphaproteobacteria bacterium]
MKKTFLICATCSLAACVSAPKELENQQVFFAFDSAEISSDARTNLQGQALYMKQNPEIDITLQGRCDERGSTEYNLALGALRAGNAAHIMIREGIEPERVKTVSYGKENPIYPGTGEEIWAKNRNTTTVIRKSK